MLSQVKERVLKNARKLHLFLLWAFLVFFLPLQLLHAEEGVEDYYRPYSKEDMHIRLPEGNDGSNEDDSYSALTDRCPEEINIGMFESNDRPVFGDVEINVDIDEGIYIDCGIF